MSLSIGIVGLPNVGKSTLFNALVKKQLAFVANYPFATIEPNVGLVDVPDERLWQLAEIVRNDFGSRLGDKTIPQKVIPATVKFYDIAGLVKGAHKGEGLGNEFLSHIREVDAIAHVIRDFEDDNVVRAGSISPQEDKSTIEMELIFADLSSVERILQKDKDIGKSKTPQESLRFEVLNRILEALNQGKPARSLNLTDKEFASIKGINLLTLKPVLYVHNISEDKIANLDIGQNLNENNDTIYICAKVELELCMLPEEEQPMYLKEFGLKEPGLNKLIRASYKILGLQSFFTAGPKEVRAWTIPMETKAPQAAGVIHSDFERGFIGADVISYSDLFRVKSLKKAKDMGLIKLEGKDYVMQDGDVVEFRFNV